MILSVLAALSEPARLEAMRHLGDGTEHCVCELMDALGARQSRMSRRLRVLKQTGLVVDRRDAQWVCYRLNPDLPPELAKLIDAVLAAETNFEWKVA